MRFTAALRAGAAPLQRIDELRKLRTLRTHHPELWAQLRELDGRARAMFGPGPLGQFKKDWSVERLEERFAREEKGGKT